MVGRALAVLLLLRATVVSNPWMPAYSKELNIMCDLISLNMYVAFMAVPL